MRLGSVKKIVFYRFGAVAGKQPLEHVLRTCLPVQEALEQLVAHFKFIFRDYLF